MTTTLIRPPEGLTTPVETSASPTVHSRWWPVAGVLTGALGIVTTYMTPMVEEAAKAGGVDGVYDALDDPTPFRIAASVGFLVVLALVIWGAGFVKLLHHRTPRGALGAGIAQAAIAASAGAMIISYGFKAMLAGGIRGGIDAAMYTTTDVAVLQLLVDQSHWLVWIGVAITIGVTAWTSFRYRAVPRWIGGISAVAALLVFVVTTAFALPYVAGIVAPVWIVVASAGLIPLAKRS